MADRMAALVYHAGALGDFITTLPALYFWKNSNGDERLVLLGKPAFGNLAKEAGVIDDCYDADDRRSTPLFYDHFGPEAENLLAPFETAIVFSDDTSTLVRNIRQSRVKTCHSQPPFPNRNIHVVDYHLSLFVDPVTLPDTARIPGITVSRQAIEATYAITPDCRPFVVIHPGSGSRRKNWPFERFLETAERLQKLRYRVVWIKGPAEDPLPLPSDDIVLKEQPLPLLAAILSRSRLFVGNDSGITHLAAAVGCPTVALFGPSDPEVWAPRGRSVTVICKKVGCSPCHLTSRNECVCNGECLFAITVDEVAEAVATVAGVP
jgi:heptosyltransferase-3